MRHTGEWRFVPPSYPCPLPADKTSVFFKAPNPNFYGFHVPPGCVPPHLSPGTL